MATPFARATGETPPSVEDITRQAANFEYNDYIPLRYWLRTADTIQKEAQIYEQEGNAHQTYLLLYRHALLVLERLEKHPEAGDPKNKKALGAARKAVTGDLLRLEKLKPYIEKRYKKHLEDATRRNAKRESQSQRPPSRESGRLASSLNRLSLGAKRLSNSAAYESKYALDAANNRDLAAKLAQREIKKRDSARRAVRQAGVTEEQEQERRTGGLWGNWEESLALDYGRDDLSRQIQETGRRRNDALSPTNGAVNQSSSAFSSRSYQYPTLPPKGKYSSAEGQLSSAPPPPPKEAISREDWNYEQPPLLPERSPALPPRPQKSPSYLHEAGPPPVPSKYFESDASDTASLSASSSHPEQNLNSSDYSFKPTAFLENGTPLRTLFLPPDLRQRFLDIAAPNTQSNLETCGILCGTLISNALFVSRLVIPEQKSTSDTCETVNESALFDYCDEHDLMVLGWIHTHPSQTCFMSSRDLHTHCGYQVMLPESIAIVCAPTKSPSWGVFRLTDPPGMRSILNCNQTGLFHPHSETNTYTDALRPGHVFECPGLEYHVKDLRP